jgi:hypothetical protein
MTLLGPLASSPSPSSSSRWAARRRALQSIPSSRRAESASSRTPPGRRLLRVSAHACDLDGKAGQLLPTLDRARGDAERLGDRACTAAATEHASGCKLFFGHARTRQGFGARPREPVRAGLLSQWCTTASPPTRGCEPESAARRATDGASFLAMRVLETATGPGDTNPQGRHFEWPS